LCRKQIQSINSTEKKTSTKVVVFCFVRRLSSFAGRRKREKARRKRE